MTSATRPHRKPRRLSTILRELAGRADERISIGAITASFGDRSFPAVMLIFGLLTIVSLVPGATTIVGAPLVVVAFQLVRGQQTLWLPERLRVRTVRPEDIGRLNARFLPMIRRLERLMAPRLSFLVGPLGTRVIGTVCLVLSLIIVMPIPFGNMLPGLSVALLALALLSRDGIAAIAGLAMAATSVLFLISFYGAAIFLIFR